jgi:transcriptional regulator with XRE-family HTH domain
MESLLPDNETLGARIKNTRTLWGWPQEKLAKCLQVDQASISFWERDKIIPSGSAQVAICALFDCDQFALLDGDCWSVPAQPRVDLPIFRHLLESPVPDARPRS